MAVDTNHFLGWCHPDWGSGLLDLSVEATVEVGGGGPPQGRVCGCGCGCVMCRSKKK